ncbi:MAG: YdeI/OmpD-associated family protein [Pseudomonadota bacterium]|uniref:YdeI/OmpD-associated family protein n=1 Tax=Sphingomonas sp. ERG5 TaxID=1381597 RepID=UPI00054B3167|nr:YdeI/OmpD-associated family protein [Sphingomonas sp. ERG5]
MPSDPRVDTYITACAPFAQPILTWCRTRLHAVLPEVEETIKWGMPSFMYHGKPLAGMAAFKAHASFGFWKREALATGREGEAMGQFGKLTATGDLPDEAVFDALIREAAALVDAGAGGRTRAARPPKPEAEVPPELAEALADDDFAAATFNAFPPSCRREYCEWIGDAKRPETRAKRTAETIGWLREGKRRNWKYENC